MADNDFTLDELEALFENDEPETPPAQDDQQKPPAETAPPTDDKKKAETKAFSDRLNADRLATAKAMGYNSHEEMLASVNAKKEAERKEKERKAIEEKGLDPKDVSELVDKMTKERMDADPRLLELDAFRKQQAQEYGKKQLAEITKLTNGEITNLNQLPKSVIDLWSKNGDLKAAFLQIEGEKLIIKARSAQSKGTTEHMQNPSGPTPPPSKTRPLTTEEIQVWKQFHPSMTDEEIAKKTMPT